MSRKSGITALRNIVDKLGELKIRKKEIEEKEESLKALLKGSGLEILEGKIFRFKLQRSKSVKVDRTRIEAEMGVSWLRIYTQETPYDAVMITDMRKDS